MTNEPLTAENFKTNASAIAYHFTRSGDPDDMAELEEAIEALVAQEVAKATAGTPIPHNGKLYYPDANGWYDMECCPDNKCLLYMPRIESVNGRLPKKEEYVIDIASCIPRRVTGWQPLPDGPVMEG